MSREEKLATFREYARMTPEERDSIIQTGFFNSYIEGYLTYTLEDLGHSPEEITKALGVLHAELDLHTAQEARKRTI